MHRRLSSILVRPIIGYCERGPSSAVPISSKLLITSTRRSLSTEGSPVSFTFIEMSNPKIRVEVNGKEGVSVLDVALDHNVDIEGACGGQMACSTCHVILEKDLYDSLPQKTDEEQDMLDLAWGLEPTSRLCCQIKVSPELNGQVFRVPAESNNMF